MKRAKTIFLGFFFFLLFAPTISADETAPESHVKKGDNYVKEERFFMAIEEYREAIKQGVNHPALYRELAATLYYVGLVDDAIIEMEKAVDLSFQQNSSGADLSSNIDSLSLELGILYLVKDNTEKAKEQFFNVLKINPGSTEAYYYLGELFLKTKDYNMAWMCAQMAQRLGHKGQDLIRKLSAVSQKPSVLPWDDADEDFYIRQILVDTREKAEEILNRIAEGELFEYLANNESLEPILIRGGFVGRFKHSELHPKIAEALTGQEVLSVPAIVETEKGILLVQRIVPFNINKWEKMFTESGKYHLSQTKNLQKSKIRDMISQSGDFKFRELIPEFSDIKE